MNYKIAQKTVLTSEYISLLKEFSGNWSLLMVSYQIRVFCAYVVCSLIIAVVVTWKVSMFLPVT